MSLKTGYLKTQLEQKKRKILRRSEESAQEITGVQERSENVKEVESRNNRKFLKPRIE